MRCASAFYIPYIEVNDGKLYVWEMFWGHLDEVEGSAGIRKRLFLIDY